MSLSLTRFLSYPMWTNNIKPLQIRCTRDMSFHLLRLRDVFGLHNQYVVQLCVKFFRLKNKS